MGTVNKNIKKVVTLFSCIAMLTTSIITTSVGSVSAAGYDYSTGLKNAIGFYDANKCGKDVATNNVFPGGVHAIHRMEAMWVQI